MQHISFFVLAHNFHFECSKNGFNIFFSNFFSNQGVYFAKGKFYHEWFYFLRINIYNLAGDLSAGHFLNQQSTTFQHVNGVGRIATTLETERSISIQPMTTSRFTNRYRIEISAFQKYVFGRFGYT